MYRGLEDAAQTGLIDAHQVLHDPRSNPELVAGDRATTLFPKQSLERFLNRIGFFETLGLRHVGQKSV
jgi:hypothetical protein